MCKTIGVKPRTHTHTQPCKFLIQSDAFTNDIYCARVCVYEDYLNLHSNMIDGFVGRQKQEINGHSGRREKERASCIRENLINFKLYSSPGGKHGNTYSF